MSKKLILVLSVAGLLILAVAAMLRISRSERPVKVAAQPVITAQPAATRSARPAVPVPAFMTGESLKHLPPTLPPEAFGGAVRSAYTIAKEIPETLAQIPCYCGCDKSVGHKSLHSCFTDDHAASCGICMNEAFSAYKLQKEEKLNPDQIREKIIAEFAPKL